MTTAHPHATEGTTSRDDSYARHFAPGYGQERVHRLVVVRVVGAAGPDPVTEAMGLFAGVMGAELHLLVIDGLIHENDLRAAKRLMLQNPRCTVEPVSADLARYLVAQAIEERRLPYVLVDLTPGDRRITPRLSWPEGAVVRYLSRSTHGVCVGSDPRRVERIARHPALGGPDDSGLAGSHGILLAARLLADALAAVGAYTSPWGFAAMPRAPEMFVQRAIRRVGPDAPQRLLTLLIVGAGGALSHNFLEALRSDRVLRRIARIILIDPQIFDHSTNFSRQILAGGPHHFGFSKAEVTAQELLANWQACSSPEIVPVPEFFHPEMIATYDPDIVALFADNFAARESAASAATRSSAKTRLLLYAATEFTYAVVRSVLTGSGCCFDCGPEQLRNNAEAETEENANRAGVGASCAGEVTSSNVLSNALAGALAASSLRRFLLQGPGGIRPQRTIVNWDLPRRYQSGPLLTPCGCWPTSRTT